MNRGDGQEVPRVDDGLQLVELGRQGLGRADTAVKKTIYRSTLLVWAYESRGLLSFLGGPRVERKKMVRTVGVGSLYRIFVVHAINAAAEDKVQRLQIITPDS